MHNVTALTTRLAFTTYRVKARHIGMAIVLIKSKIKSIKFKNSLRNILIRGDFNAQTGNLVDCLLLDDEINNIEARANRDTKINANGRLLIDLCKTKTIDILNGRIDEDKHIGEYTCVTHNGKRSVEYTVASTHF